MMTKHVYKIVDVEIIEEENIVEDYDEEGNVIGTHAETVRSEKPIWGIVTQEMTPEQEKAYNDAKKTAVPRKNYEQRIAELETVNAMLSDTLDMLLTEIIPNLTEEEI